jgi:ABC-type bacteriocin/lantibiotic exporter with double-glycine peptidase domain
MPKPFLPVEHFSQVGDSACLAACAQMVLSYLGIRVEQTKLYELFETNSLGAPLSRLTRLTRYKVSVHLNQGDDADLRRRIDAGLPSVIFVLTSGLSYWEVDTRHAVVVVGYDDSGFFLNDPAFNESPIYALTDEVMLAWSEFDYTYALVSHA